MDINDYLKTIENGDTNYVFDHGQMQIHTLILTIRNRVYLEHIISELYTEKEQKAKIFESLEQICHKMTFEALAGLATKQS